MKLSHWRAGALGFLFLVSFSATDGAGQVVKGDGGGDRPTSLRVIGVDASLVGLSCFDGQMRQVVLHWSGSNQERLLTQTCSGGVFQPNIKLELARAPRCQDGERFALQTSDDRNGAGGLEVLTCRGGRWLGTQSQR